LSENLKGRPSCRWEDNIRTDLKEMGCEDDIQPDQDNQLSRRTVFLVVI
jgi:hypothetical protein